MFLLYWMYTIRDEWFSLTISCCEATTSLIISLEKLVVSWLFVWTQGNWSLIKVLVTVTHRFTDVSRSDQIGSVFLLTWIYMFNKSRHDAFHNGGRCWRLISRESNKHCWGTAVMLCCCCCWTLCLHCRRTVLTTSRFCCAWTALICLCAEHTPSAPPAPTS